MSTLRLASTFPHIICRADTYPCTCVLDALRRAAHINLHTQRKREGEGGGEGQKGGQTNKHLDHHKRNCNLIPRSPNRQLAVVRRSRPSLPQLQTEPYDPACDRHPLSSAQDHKHHGNANRFEQDNRLLRVDVPVRRPRSQDLAVAMRLALEQVRWVGKGRERRVGSENENEGEKGDVLYEEQYEVGYKKENQEEENALRVVG